MPRAVFGNPRLGLVLRSQSVKYCVIRFVSSYFKTSKYYQLEELQDAEFNYTLANETVKLGGFSSPALNMSAIPGVKNGTLATLRIKFLSNGGGEGFLYQCADVVLLVDAGVKPSGARYLHSSLAFFGVVFFICFSL